MIDMTFVIPGRMASDTYTLHQNLCALFGLRGEMKYLWSVLPSRGDDAALLLVRGPATPAAVQPGFISPVPTHCTGDDLDFAVIAYPKKKAPLTRKPMHFSSGDTAGREAWFHRRAEAAGFSATGVSLVSERRNIVKPGLEKGAGWSIDATTFTGRARVTDAALFNRMLLNGFGNGRAWGCGLFTTRALQPSRRPGGI